MWMLCLVLLFLQVSVERRLLEIEDARAEDAAALVEALQHPDPYLRRIAARGLGRMERPRYARALLPLLDAVDPELRKEAANALGQMGADVDLGPYLEKEKDGAVQAVIYETMGRLPRADEPVLRAGLSDPDPRARTGAAKGLYFLLRRDGLEPAPETLSALRRVLRPDNPSALLKLALLSLKGGADRESLSRVADHPDPQVRRLAVLGMKTWKKDPSHIVRYAALKVAANCERARASLQDPSDHVVLLAIDKMGELGCSPAPLEALLSGGTGWRRASRALVALAKLRPASARRYLPRFAAHRAWQARVYAAKAAKILKAERVLARLLQDAHPNVVAAALVHPEDALRALESPHYGLLMEATKLLKGWHDGASAVPALLDALERVSAEGRATSRDPRRQMLRRLREFGDERIVERLRPLLGDFDPVIARLAAEILTEKTGRPVEPLTRRLATSPPPPQTYIDGLKGAKVRIRMKEAGTFTLELLPEEAPVTAATFARLAEKGYYTGLTFHRVVPNFVIQGGSPGANEYVGTAGYIRDELGLLSHERGTVGISTRGRDTGDRQIFINLVDNYRLDHNYTVFARVTEGMDVVDRILEGDVMETVEILRAR